MIGLLRRIFAGADDPDDWEHERAVTLFTGDDLPHLQLGHLQRTPIPEPDPLLGMRTDRSDDPTVHNSGRPSDTTPAPRRQATPTRPRISYR